jgi:hypothetical protein
MVLRAHSSCWAAGSQGRGTPGRHIERIVLEYSLATAIPPAHGGAQARRVECKPQASLEDHVREESLLCQLRGAALCQPQIRISHIRQVSEPHQSCGDRWARPGLDLGHHLHPAAHHLLLPGGDHGRLQPLLCRLTLWALEMALSSKRLPEPGLIHHSDQGVQCMPPQRVCPPVGGGWCTD